MTAFLIANMAPLMFGALVVFLLFGYPVAFALAANGLAFGLLGIELGLFTPDLLQALPERVFGIMRNDTLLAIPFFTFMGLILERSGMAEDLLDTIGQLFGPLRGGLAYAVVFVGALLAATTGVVAASVISMGLISLPIMLRYGYDRRLATGVIAASGTLAQIIPPSLVLIIMADQLGRSVGDMYEGAMIPGLVLTSLYALYVVATTIFNPKAAPALPPEARTLHGSALLLRVLVSLVPPLVLIFLVLGTIFLGVATPTEGGAMGATGALILALAKRKLSFPLLRQAMDVTAKLSSFVLFILIGSTVFGLVFRGVDGDLWVEHLLTGLPGGQLGFLIVVNIMVFLLAFFLDFFELAFIVVPLLAPVAEKLGIDLVWFGILLGVNMQTSFMHPPFGFALFYLRSVAATEDYDDKVTGQRIKGITTGQIYWGAVPFVVIQVIMVALVITFPGMVGSGTAKLEANGIEMEVEMPDYGNAADDEDVTPPSDDPPEAPESGPSLQDQLKGGR
ncbi:TRAP transporter large permease subunit [Magnetospirillum sp. UT-4]|uniref:TRAP transporter large permease n=1 Tax=Magnetospirillum sp. UT-4 TaxID=2681467 RepID=UPI00137CEFA6|nr:TRAP transporter large permease subunit [Magnetospirillum sp. UT-4]CAA7618054.1 putative TRAP C4-dicarboxylate transporter, large permease component (DctM-like) [Magnetospirillum sp. UT-4]